MSEGCLHARVALAPCAEILPQHGARAVRVNTADDDERRVIGSEKTAPRKDKIRTLDTGKRLRCAGRQTSERICAEETLRDGAIGKRCDW